MFRTTRSIELLRRRGKIDNLTSRKIDLSIIRRDRTVEIGENENIGRVVRSIIVTSWLIKGVEGSLSSILAGTGLPSSTNVTSCYV
jgi:hypothetical protein